MSKISKINALAASLVMGAVGAGAAQAAANPFAASDLAGGYQQLADKGEGKCGEGMCGAQAHPEDGKAPADKMKEGKCGEGRCGEDDGSKKKG